MSMLDLAAFEKAVLETDPCEYVVVPGFVRPEALPALARDYPKIPGPGSFGVDEAPHGETFAALLEELQGPVLRDRFAMKFGVDLEGLPLQIGLRRFAERSDGNIHNDSRNKFLTALIYFNDSWTEAGGQLRFLRDPQDIESHVAEVPPVRGTLIAFKRSEHSYHGFAPCEGERRSLQMYWVSPKRGRRGGPKQKTPELFRRLKRLFKKG